MHANTIALPSQAEAPNSSSGPRRSPRPTCLIHVSRVAGCDKCREASAAYADWRRRQIAYGRWEKRRSAAKARDHLNAILVGYKLTCTQLAESCGLGESTLQRIASGEAKTVRPEVEAAILALEPARFVAEIVARGAGTMSSLATSRRLQALQAVGYPATHLAEILGCHAEMVRRWRRRYRLTIPVADHRIVAELYQKLHNRPGPCPDSAVRAREAGHAPPICWDDDGDIDSPAGRPKGYRDFVKAHPDPRTRAGAA